MFSTRLLGQVVQGGAVEVVQDLQQDLVAQQSDFHFDPNTHAHTHSDNNIAKSVTQEVTIGRYRKRQTFSGVCDCL